jgi:hypothetical protein
MKMLADKSGLRVQEILYDSSSFQFHGSELYSRGIPLTSDRSHSYFPRSIRKKWKRAADSLNAMNAADQATFYLIKNQTK